MKNKKISLLTYLLPFSLFCADFFCFDSFSGEVEWLSGYREDSFNWNIAFPTGSPNVLSELSWKDIKMWENSLNGRLYFMESFAVKFEGSYGKIVSGKNTDKDFGADNRQKLFSLSTNDAGKGEVFDILVGGGYRFPFCVYESSWAITPYFGFSNQEQHFRQYNGFQTLYIGANNPFFPVDIDFSGPIDNLHSNFRSRFKGLFAGIDLEGRWSLLSFRFSGDLLWNHYRGTGHWNLREDFVNDFIERGHGRGQRVVLEIGYDVNSSVQLGLFAKYTTMRVKNGSERTFFFVEDGNPIPPGGEVPILEAVTKLNQVNWHSFSAGITIGYIF